MSVKGNPVEGSPTIEHHGKSLDGQIGARWPLPHKPFPLPSYFHLLRSFASVRSFLFSCPLLGHTTAHARFTGGPHSSKDPSVRVQLFYLLWYITGEFFWWSLLVGQSLILPYPSFLARSYLIISITLSIPKMMHKWTLPRPPPHDLENNNNNNNHGQGTKRPREEDDESDNDPDDLSSSSKHRSKKVSKRKADGTRTVSSIPALQIYMILIPVA